MSSRVTARRRREIRKRQKARKRTNDAAKAERKLLESSNPDGLPAVPHIRFDEYVKTDAAGNVESWPVDQSGNDITLSKSK
jgi:hypothetical protein